jgi:hypothetical protein
MTDARYPIGRHQMVDALTPAQRAEGIELIAAAPENLRRAVYGLGESQLDTPYRPGGWTVRQVVHHLPDSHMNAYVRFKLALTEEQPAIKTYQEARWAETADARAPIDISLTLLEALHQRWVLLMKGMGPGDFGRTLMHPESGIRTLDAMLGMYAWHGRHHTAHITTLRERMAWR